MTDQVVAEICGNRRSAVGAWVHSGFSHGFLDNSLDLRQIPLGKEVYIKSRDADSSDRKKTTRLFLLRQVHGDKVVPLDQDILLQPSFRPEGDAWFVALDDLQALPDKESSQDRSLALGIMTADCFPVILFDPKKRLAAVAHFGWRGVVSLLLENILAQFTAHGSTMSDIEVAIGPGIGCAEFETGEEVLTEFHNKLLSAQLTTTRDWYKSSEHHEDKFLIDIPAFLGMLFIKYGISERAIYADKRSTLSSECLFSYRRDKDTAGRQLSFVGLNFPLSPQSGSFLGKLFY